MPPRAVHGDRQPRIVVRALRPRVRRPAAHGILDHGQRGSPQEDAERRRRRRRARRVHPRVARPAPALELAALPRRRELWDDARRGARRQAAGSGNRAVGAHSGVVRDGSAEPRLCAAQRSAVRAVPARASRASRNTTASSRGRPASRRRRRARPRRHSSPTSISALFTPVRACRRMRGVASSTAWRS